MKTLEELSLPSVSFQKKSLQVSVYGLLPSTLLYGISNLRQMSLRGN
ncbi:hypothetical protein [Dulcicalothrix desertica]|nr:hypothetical protein [Dulcicalothrix desertica]